MTAKNIQKRKCVRTFRMFIDTNKDQLSPVLIFKSCSYRYITYILRITFLTCQPATHFENVVSSERIFNLLMVR